MRLLILALSVVAIGHGQELAVCWQDDFAQARDLVGTSALWELEGQDWRVEAGTLVATGKGTQRAIAWRAPMQARQTMAAEFTPQRRLSSDQWAVAAVLLWQDRANYWQLALCEGPPPERQRYVELAEMLQGKWKAHNTGPNALRALPTKGSFAWEYGKTYTVRLGIDGKEIRGTFLDGQGTALGELGYELGPGKCVSAGQLALRFLGLETAIDNVVVRAVPPPSPESLGLQVAEGRLGRVALLADRLPGHDSARTGLHARALRKVGFGVTPLTGRQLARPGVLTARLFDVLALVPANTYPTDAEEAIAGYLRQGGHLLAVGGRPFAEPCGATPAGWLSRSDARARLQSTAAGHRLFGFDVPGTAQGWIRNSDNLAKTESTMTCVTGGAADSPGCARIDILGYTGWDTFAKDGLEAPFGEDEELTCFWLKAAPQTKEIAVEWRERDGTRWIATVSATTEWQRVVLPPEAFHFWQQGSAKGRGQAGDRLNPQAAVHLSFGVAGSHTSIAKGDHRFWIDEVGTAAWPFARNLLTGGTGLDLDMFSGAYPWEQLDGCSRLSWLPLSGTAGEIAAPLTGSGVLGFPKPGQSVFRPFLAGLDAHGRRQTNAGGMLIHYAGSYRGARWAVFTPADQALLSSPEFAAGVAAAATRLVAPVCLTRAAPDWLNYRPGQQVELPVAVRSFAQEALRATVRMHVLSGARVVHEEMQTVDVTPTGETQLRFSWSAPQQPGSYMARTEVRVGGIPSDSVDEPFAVETSDPALACRGPLRRVGTHLAYPDGSRFFCIGANYTGAFEEHGRFFRDGSFAPRVLEAHFAAARAAGLNVWRSCGWCWSSIWEEEILRGDFRKVDLYMELARRYGIYQLIAPPGVHNLDLERRLAVYTALAKHLRGHPALLGYDLQNEPEVVRLTGMKYPAAQPCPTQQFDFVAAYPALLEPKLASLRSMAAQRRFHKQALAPGLDDEAAFRVVCAAYLYAQWRREYGITFSTFPEIGRAWPPAPKWKPLIDAIDGGLAAYVQIQAAALRAADPDALVTVGYNQCLSVFPANRGLDFVSQHVYQRPYHHEDILANITTMDRLRAAWPDKPITLGEFGYSNGISMPDGEYLDPDEQAVGEMIHWLYAIDRGYDGCKKWVLNDHPLSYMHHFRNWAGRGLRTQIYEERFGIFAWDGSPTGRVKPIGIALAALRRYIDRAGPVGKLDIRKEGDDGTAYRFVGDKALFVGARTYDADGIAFESPAPCALAADWGNGRLSLTATTDVAVRLDTRPFLGLPAARCTAPRATIAGDTLSVPLLAGQTLVVAPKQ